MPLRRNIPFCMLALATLSSRALSQAAVPITTIPDASVVSAQKFGSILGLTHLPNGEVLVNDAGRRQVLKLNASMSSSTIVIDSTPGTSNSYGPRATPMLRYLGDSSLFVDAASSSLLVIDPSGKVTRAMSAPNPRDLQFLGGAPAYVDDKGRLVYRAAMVMRMNAPAAGRAPAMPSPPDSMAVLRADFDTRKVDTLGKVKMGSGTRASVAPGADGKMQVKMIINPINIVDDYAVLADGSVAFIRGQDYHVDMLSSDGQMIHGDKMPYDWKRLSDEDKQKMLDSAKAAAGRAPTTGASGNGATFSTGGGAGAASGASGATMTFVIAGGPVGGGDGGRSVAEGMAGGQPMAMAAPVIETVSLKEMSDYLPSIRSGAARPDLDGNLWVLPNTSAQSKDGELVYDVVNAKGQLTRRVRLPKGRSVVGFGARGIVYMMNGDRTTGFTLERSTIPTM
ncbi:MAG: hypothetical protein IT353_17230 [Gemmatimonadaceae bacterium]|nr:hypothetical protein [Gemmatimonadaceae bacterium]